MSKIKIQILYILCRLMKVFELQYWWLCKNSESSEVSRNLSSILKCLLSPAPTFFPSEVAPSPRFIAGVCSCKLFVAHVHFALTTLKSICLHSGALLHLGHLKSLSIVCAIICICFKNPPWSLFHLSRWCVFFYVNLELPQHGYFSQLIVSAVSLSPLRL